ncbi:hypothetical protein TIFTF001_021527, partial [Ficus carica]
TKPQQQ